MSDVTRILNSIEAGDPKAAEELLPLVYQELRRLAAAKMARESPGQTLQPTALVHEAWLRLAGEEKTHWEGRAQFFSAAAEAMRRILIDRARKRKALKRGGADRPLPLEDFDLVLEAPTEELLAVHESLDGLAIEDEVAADLVKLRYFVGMDMQEAATALGLKQRTAERIWTFAKAWLRRKLQPDGGIRDC